MVLRPMGETAASQWCPSLYTTGSFSTAHRTTPSNSTLGTSSSTQSPCPTLVRPPSAKIWAPSPTSIGRSPCTRNNYRKSQRRRTGPGWIRCPQVLPTTPVLANPKRDTCVCTAANSTPENTAWKSIWGLTPVTNRSSVKFASGPSETPATWTSTSGSTQKGTHPTGATFVERSWSGDGTWRDTSSPDTLDTQSRNWRKRLKACMKTPSRRATMRVTWTSVSPTTRATKSPAKITTKVSPHVQKRLTVFNGVHNKTWQDFLKAS